MRISLSILGTEVMAFQIGEVATTGEPGDCTTYPVGFAPSPGDQRWESGPDL